MASSLPGRWIWLAWERHRRTSELARDWGVEAAQFESSLPRVLRHLAFVVRTLARLVATRPDGVIVQNPSLLLAAIVAALRCIFGFTLVVDAHNAGVRPEGLVLGRLRWLCVWTHRQADLTIVTNRTLAHEVKANGGRPFVLPDRIPDLPVGIRPMLKGRRNVVCVSTFAADEPIDQVLHAAASLPDGITIYVTGRPRTWARSLVASAPSNVVFTGFLPEAEYVGLLAAADAVLDLTTREDCLVCGAYEAVALGKPLVLSDTPVLRETFGRGAIFTANTAEDIARAVREVCARKDPYALHVVAMRRELERDWEVRKSGVLRAIAAYSSGEAPPDVWVDPTRRSS